MLDLKRLVVFREVARLGSFSAAAEALQYSQPAISHHVARLELELGTTLLERTRRGHLLTPAGSALLRHAERILDHVDDAEAELAELIGGTSRRVRLCGFSTGNATLLVDALVGVRSALPDVQFTLVESEPADSVRLLTSREADLGLVFDSPSHALDGESELRCTYLLDDAMLLAMPAGHRLVGEPQVPLEALREEDWIEGAGAETPCSLILIEACQRAGFEPRIAFQSGNYQVVQRLVAAGVGVALIPTLALSHREPGIVLRPLAPATPVRRVGVATPRGVYFPPGVVSMVSELERVCAAQQVYQDQLLRDGARTLNRAAA